MKKKICVFDLFNEGHHWFYNYNLINGILEYDITYVTSNLTEEQREKLSQDNVKIKELKISNKSFEQLCIIRELFDCISYCKKNKIKTIINLYFDRYILANIVLKVLLTYYKIESINTLHWFPNNKIKKLLLRLNRTKDIIIVHTEDVKQKLSLIGVKNVKVINYPVKELCSLSKNHCIKELGIDNKKINLLYFGGTRYDKGIDILLESLKYVGNIEKLRIIIAGREETFKKDFIMNKLCEIDKLDYKIELEYISEMKMNKYFIASDAVVLPYRKIFNGESGIITEALNNGVPVIAPDIIHFKEKLNKTGVTYECESIDGLAKVIDYTINNIEELVNISQKNKEVFRIKNSINNFRQGYFSVLKNKI